MIVIAFILSIYSFIFSNEEDYYGHYFNQDKVVEFNLDENGITNLRLKGSKIEDTITYDYVGFYGNTLFLQIKYTDKNKCENIIKVLIDNDEGNFNVASGYYIKYSYRNEELKVENKFAFELSFDPKK